MTSVDAEYTYPVEVYSIKREFSKETQQVDYKLRSVVGRADHTAEDWLGRRAVVVESPATKCYQGFQFFIFSLEVSEI